MSDAKTFTVCCADKVLADRVTAEELLKLKGVYHQLYKLQAEALKNVGIGE